MGLDAAPRRIVAIVPVNRMRPKTVSPKQPDTPAVSMALARSVYDAGKCGMAGPVAQVGLTRLNAQSVKNPVFSAV